MEQWESLIESYPREATLRDFVKAVETAEAVAKEDLAPFESDWFIRTLLSSPVDLIQSVRRHHHEDVWSSTVVRCFSLVEALGERVQDYQEDLFKISQLPHSAAGRRRALLAVRALAPWLGPALASHWPALLHAAQYADDAVTVRAARALLVGTICEYHPELLQNEMGAKVWRIFLCTLEAAKTTDSLTNAVLTALDGLLRSCGRDLPTAELNLFYDTLAQEYVYICSCRDACLKLLANHSNLFPERLAQDLRLRTHLWNEIPNVSLAAEAITSVYLAAANANNVESMAVQEVYPRTVSSSALVKNTACCVLATMLNMYRDKLPGVGEQFDRHVSSLCTSLEFSLSSKLDAFGDDDESKWEYDGELMNLIQQASWCIQTNVVGCESLLRSIILLYRKIPAAQRKKYVVHTLLKAEPALRTCAITFLISETTKLENETPCIHKYFSIWEQIFDTNSGKDSIVMDNSKAVFEDFILYVLFALEDFMENNFVGDFNRNTSQRLSTLLNFTSQILQLENVKDYASEYIEIFLELVLDATEICLSDGQLLCLTSLVSAAEENCMFEDGSLSKVLVKRLMSFYENLQIDRCRDEGILCASCLTLMEAPDSLVKNVDSTLTALLVIFSRDDVEPKTLSRALRKLETIILSDRCSSEESIICDVISKVNKIRSRKDFSGKFAKILHRDVLLFMGKFGHKIDENNNIESDKLMIIKLKEKLILNIPNPSDGKSYKLNLERILDLALLHEDSKALHSLLLIICANLSSRPDPTLQSALSAVLHKLTRCHARGDTASVPPGAGCCGVGVVRHLITYITVERSPGVRALLARLLETVLLRAPHSDAGGEALRAAVEHSTLMMGSQSSITKRAGLDLAETALTASKDNSSVVEYLPKLLNSILRTNETDFDITYEEATQCFAKNSVLFTQDTLVCTSKDLLETLTSVMFDELNLEKAVKLTVNTFRDIFSRTPETDKMFLDLLKDSKMDGLKYLLVLSEAKKSFEFTTEACAKIASADNFKVFTVIKELLDGNLKRYTFEFCLKIVYKFMTEYADAMLELKYVVTLELLNLAVTKTTPVHVKKLHKHIEECIKSFAFIWKNTPSSVIDNFGTWCKNLPLKRVTNNILKKTFVTDDAIIIYALKKMLKIFNLKQITSLLIPETCELIQRWPKELLKLFKSNYIQDFLKCKMAYLTDVLAVSLNFLKPAEVKGLILECQENSSNEKEGLKFCRFFVKSFAGYLLESNILMDVEMKGLCVLIHDVVKHFGRLECDGVICRKVVETVDQMWPTLESQLTLDQLCAILSDLQFLDTSDLQLSTNPGLWWLRIMKEVRNDDKVKLMAVLPVLLKNDVGSDVREKYTAALQSYASTLPVLSSSLTAHAPAVSALLRGVAGAPPALLPLLPTLPLAPPLPAWLSTALHACAASIATHAGTLHAVRELCTRNARTDMFDALLLPVVRYSSTKACEDFFCATMNSIISDLWPKSKSSNNFIQYAKAFALAQLAFERLPLSTLQSPTSPLYANLDLRGSKTLAAAICKICKTLRDGVARGNDVRAYRSFQQANFNCFAAVLCKTRSGEKFFQVLFQDTVWDKIVDDTKQYKLYIQPLERHQSTKRHTLPAGANETELSLSQFTAPVATFFTRTLSDNPRAYMLEETRPTEPQHSLPVQDNELNDHPCASALTGAIAYLSRQQAWLPTVPETASGNARWLFTQIIINCKDKLKSSADSLTPQLLRMVATTPYEHEGKKLLNGLHVNTLKTIAYWAEENKMKKDLTQQEITHLNTIIPLYIHTCVYHKHRSYVFKALMQAFNEVLKLYADGVHVQWGIFDGYLKDPTNEPACLELLTILSKNSVYIEQLAPAILKMMESKQILAKKLSNTATLLGLALSACHDSSVTAVNLSRLWKVLDRMRTGNDSKIQDYVKVLFYTQNGYKLCCNESNFRHITALAPKMVREEKAKCFEILSSYLARTSSNTEYVTSMWQAIDICESMVGEQSNLAMKLVKSGLHLMEERMKRRTVMLAADFCSNTVVKVRRLAFEVMLRAFEDIQSSEDLEPAAKRRKGESSKILDLLQVEDVYTLTVVAKLGQGLVDEVADISSMVQQGVVKHLSSDMSVRLCESMLIALNQPASVKPSVVARALTAAVRMWVQALRDMDAFKMVLLRDEPLEVDSASTSAVPSKLLTMTRTYQGTFRTHFSAGRRNSSKKNNTITPSTLNVQIPIDEILETLLKFSERDPDTATTLLTEVIKSVQKQQNFDFNSRLSQLLCSLLDKGVTLRSTLLVICRCVLDDCCKIPTFKTSLLKLKEATLGSEAECITSLLYEDVVLRSEYKDMFILGNTSFDEEDEQMEDSSLNFSLQDLISTFDKLSNWDILTIQEKKKIQRSSLPMLWTDHDSFAAAFSSSEELPPWLNIMRLSLDHNNFVEKQFEWTKQLDVCPKRNFENSAITEAIEWHSIVTEGDINKLPRDIRPSDCLAKWAVRLMTRSLYLSQLADSNDSEPVLSRAYRARCRSHELRWCERAADLSASVLSCLKRNAGDLNESETLPWLYQHISALRTSGLSRNCAETLSKALAKADQGLSEFAEKTSPDVIVAMNRMKLLLNSDLESLTTQKTEAVLQDIDRQADSILKDSGISNKCMRDMESAYEISLHYYNDNWEHCTDKSEQTAAISSMASCFGRVLALKHSQKSEMFLSVVLDRLAEYQDVLDEDVAEDLLTKIEAISETLNEFTLSELNRINHVFPSEVLRKHVNINSKISQDGVENKFKLCLQLVCDPAYSLSQYCYELDSCLKENDGDKFEATFKVMLSLTNNEFAGPAFQLLTKYTDALKDIKDYEYTKEYNKKARKAIHDVLTDMSSAQKSSLTLPLSELCPALTSGNVCASEEDRKTLSRLLRLDGLEVVQFDKQVQVYLGSIRRPCTIAVLCSDGRTRRFLVKRGEPLRSVAAVHTALAYFIRVQSSTAGGSHHVIPLSADCAVMQYLEDHVTARSMVARKHNLNEITASVRRPPDDELILASAAATLAQHRQLSDRVPAHALRSSIEEDSCSLQDFMQKKRKFAETLGSNAIHAWILGIGDRHLENLMYDRATGCLVDIDVGPPHPAPPPAAPPPARLTRVMAAVGGELLESRLQSVLASLRDSHKLLIPSVKMLFKWMPEYESNEFQKKMQYIEDILKGKRLSYQVTVDVLRDTIKVKHADKYIALLTEIFEDVPLKETYAVEEQVTCLLRHCTEPRILSVTRTGWEPWL